MHQFRNAVRSIAPLAAALATTALTGCGASHTPPASASQTSQASQTPPASPNDPNASAAAPPVNAGSKGGAGLPGAGDPPIYWTTIERHIAEGLHRSTTDLTRMWGPTTAPGPKGSGLPAATTILDVATEEGLSRSQLRSLELTAIQQASDVLVQQGSLTRQQADARIHTITGWGQTDLDGYTMYAFQPH